MFTTEEVTIFILGMVAMAVLLLIVSFIKKLVREEWERQADDGWYLRLSGPIHKWFGLTRSNYVVLPRVLLQSMPVKWQKVFVEHLDSMGDTFDYVERPDSLQINAKEKNKYVKNPIPHYKHKPVITKENWKKYRGKD